VKLYNHAVAPNPRRVCILAAALRVTCNGGRPQVARPPVHPHVTRNGGVGPRHSSLSTSPSRTTLAASDPGVDHPQFPSFPAEIARTTPSPAEIARTTPSGLKTGSISTYFRRMRNGLQARKLIGVPDDFVSEV
jgi:hypothetical protein